jgi:uncharacterized LabA/DUF88 family protein
LHTPQAGFFVCPAFFLVVKCKYLRIKFLNTKSLGDVMNNSQDVARIEFGADGPAQKIAVLIDADNAQAAIIGELLKEVAAFGEITVKRIYGDFTSPNSGSWKSALNEYSIKPIQQFAYTTGKNATDSTLIIDAMDLLYTGRIDSFCLVSSDSDFTGLAVRIREAGLRVFGFGEQKTPVAFRNACHKFVFTEVLRPKPLESQASQQMHLAQHKEFPRKFILDALEQAADDAGWAHIGTFGSYLTKLQPDFDSRLYGFKKLSDLVKAKKDIFIIEERAIPSSNTKVLYLRAKNMPSISEG